MISDDRQRNRTGRTGFLQRVALFFLAGFFFGGIFYYFFQASFAGMMERLELNAGAWPGTDSSFGYNFFRSVWNHGKYFGLLWLLSGSRVIAVYQPAFVVYTGVRNGFLLLFFVMGRGFSGIFLYFASLFPHGLIFLPLYLFSFAWIREKGEKKRRIPVGAALVVLFFFGCFLECRFNLPVMASFL